MHAIKLCIYNYTALNSQDIVFINRQLLALYRRLFYFLPTQLFHYCTVIFSSHFKCI